MRLYHPGLDRWHEFPDTAQAPFKAGWVKQKPARRVAEPAVAEEAPAEADQTTANPGGEEKPRRRRNHDEES